MERAELDHLAYAGAGLPTNLPYAETLYFLMLRALYQNAKRTGMDPEQGRREKGKIERAVQNFLADQALAVRRAKLMLETGSARAEYRKARAALFLHGLPPSVQAVIESADRMAESLDNMRIEDGDEHGVV